jgi:cyanophycinase
MFASRACLIVLFACFFCPCASFASNYKYMRTGSAEDRQTHPAAGIAMMGGGSDLDEAFSWLCRKAAGGDFLVLRARGDDEYNSYVNGLCKLNSVATLVIPDRESAGDARVADIIRHAEALFIAGGDQSRYVNFWQRTPVEEAINSDIADGKPIGGTSAGFAVLGEFVYGAMNDKPDDADLSSPQALRDPYQERVTLVRDFLQIPQLKNFITDSHFAKRDRMGRSLVFLARIVQDGWEASPREIAIDEKSAVLVEPDGRGLVVGPGYGAYFIRPTKAPTQCRAGVPLSFPDVAVFHARRKTVFDLAGWKGEKGESYILSVEQGSIHSSQGGNAAY